MCIYFERFYSGYSYLPISIPFGKNKKRSGQNYLMKFIINLTYPMERGFIFADKQDLSEVEVGYFCSFPGCVFGGSLEANDLSEASLVHESFFLAFP